MSAALFKVPERAGRAADVVAAKKANSKSAKSSTVIRGGGGLAAKINAARAIIEQKLGKYKDDYNIIHDSDTLDKYITACIRNGSISIDTETTGLDPMRDQLVGISIYTPGQNAAYIPIGHKSYITGEAVPGQLLKSEVKACFSRLEKSDVRVIMFNAAFDIRVLRHGIGVDIPCSWDCYLASRCLNENEEHKNLKALYSKYCTDGNDSILRFDTLFNGLTFDIVPIKLGYIYASHDAYMTYKLYAFQKPLLTAEDEECYSRDLQDVAWVFHNIEMPCVPVVVDMEDTGIELDLSKSAELHDKYRELLKEKTEAVHNVLTMYEDDILQYRINNPLNKLSDPISLNSPQQIAIVLYDIMGVKAVDKDSPRGTGEKILSKIDNAFTKALLEYRGIQKLIDTYIDKLPDCVNPVDGRIHCKFNQYGADTGRFSSSDPNLQNIPSHNKEIRQMFKATDGYVLLSSDYSQQEQEFIRVPRWDYVETPDGWRCANKVVVGDILRMSENDVTVDVVVRDIIVDCDFIVYYL